MESRTGTSGTRLGLIGLALVILVLVIVVAAGLPPPLRAGPVGLDDAHLAVWRIHNDKPITERKHKKYTTGTAFALGAKHFVTNAHNLRDLVVVAGVPIPGVLVSQGRGAAAVTRRIDQVLRLSEIHDLALFTTKREVGHWLRVAPNSDHLTRLTAIGYPGGHYRKRMRQVGRASKDRFGWEFQLPVDVDDLGSASGSPVLDLHGRVVGVFFQAVSNMATALSVEHLRAFGWHREGTDWVSCGRGSFRLCHQAAVENVRARARQKDPIAQSRQWHLYTEDVIDGDVAVLDSLKEAASQGLRAAQLLLAFAYHDGDFVVADRTMRDLWYTRAAEQQDSALAQYNRAANIRRSEPNRARALLKPLAERGFVPAKKLLKKIPVN